MNEKKAEKTFWAWVIFYGVTPYEGRYDTGYGQVLLNTKKGWIAPSPLASGLKLDGEVRMIQRLRTIGKKWMYLAARNNDTLIAIEPVRQ